MTRAKGFTLIELLVALALLTVLFAGLYTSFQTGLAAFKRSENYLMRDRDQEVFYMQLDQELRNAVPFSMAPFIGQSDRIIFPSRLSRFTSKGPEEGLYLIEYRFKNGTLSRKETKLKKESLRDSDPKPEILFEGVQICHFDFLMVSPGGPEAWTDQWSNKPYTGV